MPPTVQPLIEPWKATILRYYLALSVAGTGVLWATVIQAAGWRDPITVALGLLLVGYAALLWLSVKVPRTLPWLGLCTAGMVLSGVVIVSALAPPTLASVKANFLLVPLVAGFLSDRRWMLGFWALSSAACVAMFWGKPGGEWFDLIGLCTLSALISGLVWLSERERERWQARARQQQGALEVAVAAAEAAAAAQARFLATMSHEIRTPMNGVLGLTEALLDSGLAPEQEALAQTVHSSGRLLHHVLNDILDLSRIESGQTTIAPQPTELRRLLRHVASLHQESAQRKGLRLSIQVDPAVPQWGLVDDARLSQVLINLLSNAIKFTEHGEIRVEVRPVGEAIYFAVTDTGTGLGGVDIAALFQPFVQADASTQRRFGGTGLGLAISSRLCALMGGEIGADARKKGARFWFRLPIPPTQPAQERSVRTSDDLRGLQILVAEDNAVNQLVIRRTLEALGAQMTLAHDGQEVLDLLAQALPDVILMDCHMPVLDGFEATRRVRALHGPAASLPILALTASVTAEDRRQAAAAGMDAVVAKPIDRSELVSAVHDALRAAQAAASG